MKLVAGTVVVAFGVFLVGLAVVIVTRPRLAERFFASFASSARAHYTEQALRLIVGAAMLSFARWMWHPTLFRVFGGLIAVTAIALLLMPWRWHHRFGQWAIPFAIRRLRLFAFGAAALGALVLYAASRAVLR